MLDGFCEATQFQNKYPYGEVSTAVINIISEFPDVLQTSMMETRGESLVDMKNLFVEAAFAQHFIFM